MNEQMRADFARPPTPEQVEDLAVNVAIAARERQARESDLADFFSFFR